MAFYIKLLFLIFSNFAFALGASLISDPRVQELATRMDVIGIINGKVLAGNISNDVQQGTAQAFCQDLNGTMVIVESAAENDMIQLYMNSNNIAYFWTDLSDYGHEGVWHWASNGKPLNEDESYSNWADGQPTIDKSKNCATIDGAGTWSVSRCTSPNGDQGLIVKALCQLLLK